MPTLRTGGRKLALVALLAAALSTFYVLAEDIPTIPGVTVVGYTVEEVALTCFSGPCFDSAQEEAARAFQEWLLMYEQFPQDELPLDREQFCETLASKQPSTCSLSNPPASPGITVPGRANYAPNGCGTGGVGTWFQDAILEVLTSTSYSGNINEPYAGASFLSACNAHDTCWGSGGARYTCDLAFRAATESACGVVSDPSGYNECIGFSGGYHFAVSTTDRSHSAYQTSLSKRACALWAMDMRGNDCDD